MLNAAAPYLDTAETITLEQVVDGETEETAVVGALMSDLAAAEQSAGDGFFTMSAVVWELPATELEHNPAPGNVIEQSGGTRWVLTSEIRWAVFGTVWQVGCTQER